MSPISLPDGTAPCSTTTGTVRLSRGSSATRTTLGSNETTWIRGSIGVTRTGTETGPALGSTPLRSTDAAKLDAVGVGTSAAAK